MMQEAGLFPHETIADRQLGTLFIYPEQLGLKSMDLDGKSRHAVGGTLFVTQFRLLFEALPLNQIVGYTSILFDTITQVRDTSGFLKPQITVTAGVPYDFFLLQVVQPLAMIQMMMARSTPQLQAEARANLVRQVLPQGADDRPVRSVVRNLLESNVLMRSNAMNVLTAHNLWLSLGNV